MKNLCFKNFKIKTHFSSLNNRNAFTSKQMHCYSLIVVIVTKSLKPTTVLKALSAKSYVPPLSPANTLIPCVFLDITIDIKKLFAKLHILVV